VNTKLKTRGINEITDLTAAMSDGVALLQLLEIIGDTNFKINKNPKMRLHKVENMNRALEFIKSRGVNLTNIGAEDIVDGNSKLVLGMIWTIILRFTIAEISEGDLNAKEGLLLWCQRKTHGYNNVNVKDFHYSFQDGLALCALIHRHRPDLIDFDSLDKNNRAHNLQLAFDVAEKHINIPKLLEVEDIADVVKPDERSVMTYVAQYFHAFASANKVEVAGRRVGKFINLVQSVTEMKHGYEERVKLLMKQIEELIESWKNQNTANSYKELREELDNVYAFKRGLKRQWTSDKRDLDTLLGNIQTKLKTYNLKPYNPPEGLTLSDLEKCWLHLVESESSLRRNLVNHIHDIKEGLKKQYATATNAFELELNKISNSLAGLEGDLAGQLQLVKDLMAQLNNNFAHKLANVKIIHDKCIEANIEENEYTIYDYDDLVYDMGLLRENITKKTSFIENQMVAASMTNVTPQQLEEFEATFLLFDKDKSNTLSDSEFKAGLTGLDILVEDAEFDKIFNDVSKGTGSISFEQFVAYMVSVTEDKVTPSQLRAAFKALSNNKAFVTELDLQIGQIKGETLVFVKEHFPVIDNGQFHYNGFLDNVFSDVE
jgi:hypothetical protein